MANCPPLNNTQPVVQHAAILIQDSVHVSNAFVNYGTQSQRQATYTHEIGHALSIAHETEGDGCNTVVPTSIMDYDCMLAVGPSGFPQTNGPSAFDACGINHAYYDPAWGYSGC